MVIIATASIQSNSCEPSTMWLMGLTSLWSHLILLTSLWWRCQYHFIPKESEAQRCEVTCPRSHSSWVARLCLFHAPFLYLLSLHTSTLWSRHLPSCSQVRKQMFRERGSDVSMAQLVPSRAKVGPWAWFQHPGPFGQIPERNTRGSLRITRRQLIHWETASGGGQKPPPSSSSWIKLRDSPSIPLQDPGRGPPEACPLQMRPWSRGYR